MDLGLRGKAALVAASSRGLGRATAMELAREGAKVALCARNREELEAVAEAMRQETGAEVLAVPADLAKAADIHGLVSAVEARFGYVDILVTNAGGPPGGSFDDFDDAAWARAWELTLMSAVRLIRAVLPGMKARRWGRIVNITSVSVKQPIRDLILSNAYRTAVVGLAKTLATELAPLGITVNNVCPGWTLTDRVQELVGRQARQEGKPFEAVVEAITAGIPMGRMGKPEELAALIAFLASERAAYITGTTIPVDGGSVLGLL
ncbi:MAG: SDR family oxidoreductase [Anaerolineae bacterium]